MFERFIIVVLALFGTAKRLPQILHGTPATRALRPRRPSYSEVLRRVREEKALRRAAKHQGASGVDQ
ncbi:hypothetical protein [Scleromatobacter humisilvae]|uniref:Uncharacterized protein n=1 Tax=Scleromatobacter humisilvae TaxID=2897159 RepID=A0A9X2C2W6_9BURK|nr:hypothetical protein [Scleromatobacter humisilvae]MCK9687289.1 hypothetical protein [Scleromatobacter humisilvae]